MPRPGYLNWSKKNRASGRSGSSSNMSGPTRQKLFPKINLLLALRRLTKDKNAMNKLKSRKLWAAIIGSIIVTAGDQLWLSPDVTQWIATIVTGYVIGQGLADAGQALKA